MPNTNPKSDSAVSPVVGTILMVAVTVILGVAVYAAMNGFGDDSAEAAPSYGFKATAVDTDDNGRTDKIKVTYVTGPTGLSDTEIVLEVQDAAGSGATGTSLRGSDWDPGHFALFDPVTSTNGLAAGNLFTTLTVGDQVVIDKVIQIDE